MASVPWAANLIANLPLALAWTDRHNCSNNFVAWNYRVLNAIKPVSSTSSIRDSGLSMLHWSKMTLLHTYITMADTASMDFDQDLSALGFFDRNFFDSPRRAWLFDDAGFAALWNV